MRHVLSVLVENKSGVLSRVAGLISRRGFNIESLSVGPTEDPTMSRITIIMEADGYTHFDGHTEIYATYTHTKKYTMMLAHHDLRVVHVSTHVSLREACDRVKKERVLEVIEIANIFRANIVDVGKTSLTIEITGSEDKLKGIEDLLRAYGIKEIIRTGLIAMSRGSKVS